MLKNFYAVASSLVVPLFNFLQLSNTFACKSVISIAICMSLGIEVDVSFYMDVNSGRYRMNAYDFTTTNVTEAGVAFAQASFKNELNHFLELRTHTLPQVNIVLFLLIYQELNAIFVRRVFRARGSDEIGGF